MDIIKGKEKEYEDWYNENDDIYGRACFTYAERWANMMEDAIAEGKTISEVAKELSHKADEEGIIGSMYGAVSILSQFWRFGEELRRWHNLDTQIANEGEKANESGGVLNPALITVGD